MQEQDIIHWVPLKTQHKILYNFSKFIWLIFRKFLALMKNIVVLKWPKFQKKMLIRSKTAYFFLKQSQITTSQGHTDVGQAHSWHFLCCVFLFVLTWLFYDIFVKFLLSVSSIFKHQMLLRTCANCLDCLSECQSRHFSCCFSFAADWLFYDIS